MEKESYYDVRPRTISIDLMPIAPCTLRGAGCHPDRATAAEDVPIANVNPNSYSDTSILGNGPGLVARKVDIILYGGFLSLERVWCGGVLQPIRYHQRIM